jgi:uncharacterized RDD family membrane protein YckC
MSVSYPSSPASRQATTDNAKRKMRREIVTPEGVPICFQLATVGDRASALLIDIVVMLGALLALVMLASFAGIGESSWIAPFLIVAIFFLTNFYFAFFEFRWQGSTPGKRAMRLRVIDAHGGQLTASSILARNLIRELEIWMPLRFLFAGKTLWPNAPGWAVLLAMLWTFVFLLLPLFNRDELRAGDMIAGTRVVETPKAVLITDLAEDAAYVGVPQFWKTTQAQNAGPDLPRQQPRVGFSFSNEQLAVYGEYELSVLADLLRNTDVGRFERVELVVDKIQAKINYQPRLQPPQYEKFLHDFYSSLRSHLEQRMLFGKRKADKFQR